MSANNDASTGICKEKMHHRRKSSGDQIYPTAGKQQRYSWSETTSTDVTDSEVLEGQVLVSHDEFEDNTDSETQTSSTVGTSSTSDKKPLHSDKSSESDITPTTVEPQTKPTMTEATNENFNLTAMTKRAQIIDMIDEAMVRAGREHDAALAVAGPAVQDAVADAVEIQNNNRVLLPALRSSMCRYFRAHSFICGTVIASVGFGVLVYYILKAVNGDGSNGVQEASSLNTTVIQELNETLANLTLENN